MPCGEEAGPLGEVGDDAVVVAGDVVAVTVTAGVVATGVVEAVLAEGRTVEAMAGVVRGGGITDSVVLAAGLSVGAAAGSVFG